MRFAWLWALAPLAACGPDDPAGACKDNLLAGDLVITEVLADFAAPDGGTGTDDGKEWFEVYNNADRPLSLKGVTITHSRPDGSRPNQHVLEDVTIAPGQYFTLGNAIQDLLPAYVDYGYAADLGDLYNSDGGQLTLSCGTTEIDTATYENVRSGRSRQLTNSGPPDYTLNDDPTSWCEAADTEFETNNFGTPGQDNDCAPVIMGACNDAGTMRPVVSPSVDDIVITEVMPSPLGPDTDEEWFEALAVVDFDLNGLGIGRASDTTPDLVESPDCIPVTSGTHIVFARNLAMGVNGGLPAGSILATYGTALVAGSVANPGDIQLTLGGNVLDLVTWTSSSNGASLQLDPDVTSATANDDPSNFCDATTTYGAGGMGTPGAPNAECPSMPPAGQCDIGDGTFRNIIPPAASALVISELMPNPAGTDTSTEWFEITNVGGTAFDLNGLGLDRPDDSAAPVVITSSLCKSLAPTGYALFARSADAGANGGLPTPDATFGFALLQSDGQIQVVDPTSCSGTPNVCSVIHDVASWTSSTEGVSLQLPPNMLNTTANDTAANYCPGIGTYGTAGNLGTPKAVNVCM